MPTPEGLGPLGNSRVSGGLYDPDDLPDGRDALVNTLSFDAGITIRATDRASASVRAPDTWQVMSVAERALFAISAMVVAVGLTGLIAVILAGLNERRRELAILRSVGARPRDIFVLLMIEGAGITLDAVAVPDVHAPRTLGHEQLDVLPDQLAALVAEEALGLGIDELNDAGAVHHHVSVQNVSVVFCYFLQQLLDAYPNAPVIAVICDNGSTHHSGITRRWLVEHPRIQVIEGAKYSPQDNPVERLWAVMKRALANTAPTTITDRVQQAHAFFQHRTDTQNLTTAAPWTSPWLPEGYGKEFWPGA